MKHGKLIGLQTSAERLARVAVAAYDAATAPQTAPSGSISLDNADGTRTIIGPQAGSGEGAPSGQAIATHVGDTTPPPVPTGITAWSGDGSLHVMWDGTLSGDVPADFDHISILVDGKEVAQLSSAGSVTVGGVEAGATVSVTATAEDDACLADGTPAHNVSEPCAAVKVTIKDAVAEVRADADAHGEQIEAVRQDIADYKASAEATYATKTEVDERTGAITRTLAADYTRTADLAATEAVKDAKAAGTTAQSQLAGYKATNDKAVADAKAAGTGASAALADYKGVVSETYAEKTELTEAVNQLSSTMSSQYSAFTDYRKSNDTALSKAQTDATNAQSTIDSYKTSNDKAVADAKAAGTTAQSQLNSYKSSNDQAVAAARKAGTDAQSQLGSYKAATDQRLTELQNVADNAIESWYLKGAPSTSNAPAKDWTTDALRRQHAGDLYMDTDTGYSYRWSGTAWVQVKDSDVTKALKEIESVKTTYATKSELTATDTELSGRVSDALTTAKSYTDSSVEQEVTARNAAIKAQADSISLDVSRTYTRSETFAAYQTDADGRIATANSNASTAVSTAKTAASDAATAKTNASSAVSTANSASGTASKASTDAAAAVKTANSASSTASGAVTTANEAAATANAASDTATAAQTMATENRSSIKQLSNSITSEVTQRTKTDQMVSDLSSKLTQTANSLTSEISDRRSAITTVTGLANAAQSTADSASEQTVELSSRLDQSTTDITATIESKVQTVQQGVDGNASDVKNLNDRLSDEIRTRKSFMRFSEESSDPTLTLGQTDSPAQVKLTNKQLQFLYLNTVVAYMSGDALLINNAKILQQLQLGGFAFVPRENGNLSLKWVGGES